MPTQSNFLSTLTIRSTMALISGLAMCSLGTKAACCLRTGSPIWVKWLYGGKFVRSVVHRCWYHFLND